MAVYVDIAIWERHDRRWCHLLADDPAELHAFAAALGIERRRFQTKPARPWVDHYDIDEPRRGVAIERGAVELGRPRSWSSLLASAPGRSPSAHGAAKRPTNAESRSAGERLA